MAVVTFGLLAGCSDEAPEVAPPSTSASASAPTSAPTSTDDACGEVYDDALVLYNTTRPSNLGNRLNDLNGLVNEAASACSVELANDLEDAVEDLEAADSDLSGCVLDSNCNVGQVADDYNQAVEALQRAISAGS